MQRGRRWRQGLETQPLGPIPLSDDPASAKAARGKWARFIKKVFEVAPLLCPDCGGLMRIIAFIARISVSCAPSSTTCHSGTRSGDDRRPLRRVRRH